MKIKSERKGEEKRIVGFWRDNRKNSKKKRETTNICRFGRDTDSQVWPIKCKKASIQIKNNMGVPQWQIFI